MKQLTKIILLYAFAIVALVIGILLLPQPTIKIMTAITLVMFGTASFTLGVTLESLRQIQMETKKK